MRQGERGTENRQIQRGLKNKLGGCVGFEDIVGLPRHVSKVHPPMPVSDRAAQFSPFAALTGYGDAVRETGRLTEERREIDEDVKQELDEKMLELKEALAKGRKLPELSITYFVPDGKKSGGTYLTLSGKVEKIDEYGRFVKMWDGSRIPVDEIVEWEQK